MPLDSVIDSSLHVTTAMSMGDISNDFTQNNFFGKDPISADGKKSPEIGKM